MSLSWCVVSVKMFTFYVISDLSGLSVQVGTGSTAFLMVVRLLLSVHFCSWCIAVRCLPINPKLYPILTTKKQRWLLNLLLSRGGWLPSERMKGEVQIALGFFVPSTARAYPMTNHTHMQLLHNGYICAQAKKENKTKVNYSVLFFDASSSERHMPWQRLPLLSLHIREVVMSLLPSSLKSISGSG